MPAVHQRWRVQETGRVGQRFLRNPNPAVSHVVAFVLGPPVFPLLLPSALTKFEHHLAGVQRKSFCSSMIPSPISHFDTWLGGEKNHAGQYNHFGRSVAHLTRSCETSLPGTAGACFIPLEPWLSPDLGL